MKFYRSEECKNVVMSLEEANCFGNELVARTEDVAKEKHVPFCTFTEEGLNVVVGEVEHPMTVEHHIEWIVVETVHGFSVQSVKDLAKAEAFFAVKKEEVKAVYEYCNLHGLWKKEF